ncbi:ATPdependent protease La EC 342153 Type I [Bradyrhizobium sp.]|uniref:AAA family ATPase n=1 Tax=Bradyrhizobium sp. TaxID=376 RepID=UPI0007C19318|nr:AAA family ATPase [Bradyrhizobium sp.]CUT11487.1 ATPdependent protease La EC 342153 Type I [Bradyrhizobium sp.]
MKPPNTHPALQLLTHGRWDDAFGALHHSCEGVLDSALLQAMLEHAHDRKALQREVRAAVEALYAVGKPATGGLALAWSMLTCDPRRPASFWPVLPPLQYLLDNTELEDDDDEVVRRRLRTWWRAADGDFITAKASMFRLADPEAECWPDVHVDAVFDRYDRTPTVQQRVDPGPTLVVMPKAKSTPLNNYQTAYRPLIDAALPLVIVRDVQAIRCALHREFPHAVQAIDMLLRDLRDDQPFRTKSICLVGASGSGKTKLLNRLSELVSERPLHLYRFDGAVADGQFSGTSKGWSNTTPSVPVRAVLASMTANPVVLIDEIDKCKESQNGFLAHALLSLTDRFSAKNYRDQSLDAEVDLSMVSFMSTANDAALLPGMLRDRFRLIRMPSPSLQHLPLLAANVMAEIARDDEARIGEPPLGPDELSNIGKVWRRRKFSMRALKSIVEGTLEARDTCAMRH